MDKKLFSERLVALRIAKGFKTQYQFAKAYNEKYPTKRRDESGGNDGDFGGIYGTIKNYENANHPASPKLSIVCNMCELLGCDVSFLAGDYDETDFPTHKICEYTGLSETAIAKLKESEYTSEYNLLLEHGHIEALARCLHLYKCHLDAVLYEEYNELRKKKEALAEGKGYIPLPRDQMERIRNNDARRGYKADMIDYVAQITREIDKRYQKMKDDIVAETEKVDQDFQKIVQAARERCEKSGEPFYYTIEIPRRGGQSASEKKEGK